MFLQPERAVQRLNVFGRSGLTERGFVNVRARARVFRVTYEAQLGRSKAVVSVNSASPPEET